MTTATLENRTTDWVSTVIVEPFGRQREPVTYHLPFVQDVHEVYADYANKALCKWGDSVGVMLTASSGTARIIHYKRS